jgi:hypothetical protein
VLPENSIQPFSTQCNIVTPDRLASAVSVISKAFAPVNILARDKITDFESGLISDFDWSRDGQRTLSWQAARRGIPHTFAFVPG